MQEAHGTINEMLTWSVNHYGYTRVVFVKDLIPCLSSILIGIIIGVFTMAYVLKDTRLSPSEVDHISVVQIKKNNRKKLFINVPDSYAGHISLITGVVLYLTAVLVKFLPIKKIQYVNRRRVSITFIIVLLLVLFFCFFTIRVDFHAILPDGHGGYKIFEFNN